MQFIDELKQQVTEIVREVIGDTTNRRVTVTTEEDLKVKKKRATKSTAPKSNNSPLSQRGAGGESAGGESLAGQPCPVCGQGTIIKGKTAYGCSRWKEGCTFRKPFEQ
jgi:DNA topoisomerase-3